MIMMKIGKIWLADKRTLSFDSQEYPVDPIKNILK